MEASISISKRNGGYLWGATVIAWDLAYSNKGWLVIEGNDVGEPYLLQAPLQIGIKAKLIKLIDFFVQS